MKYIAAIDIGGTTFNSGIFSESLDLIELSDKNKIRHYNGKNEVVEAIIDQINDLIKKNNIKKMILLDLELLLLVLLIQKKELF